MSDYIKTYTSQSGKKIRLTAQITKKGSAEIRKWLFAGAEVAKGTERGNLADIRPELYALVNKNLKGTIYADESNMIAKSFGDPQDWEQIS